MSAILAPPTASRAASSSGSSSGLRNASRKTASIRVCVALPPDPCDIVIALFPDLGAAPPRAVDPVQHLLFPIGQRQLAPSLGGEALLAQLGLGQGLVDPALAHALPTSAASATRFRFIRPKL